MSILFDPSGKTLTLRTRHTLYQMKIDELGHLLHLYYGRTIGPDHLMDLFPPADHGFSPDYYAYRTRRGVSPDALPQEYTGWNVGDYRVSAVQLTDAGGVPGADFVYESHAIRAEKYALEGLPCAYAADGEAEMLTVSLLDRPTGLRLELQYGVFAEKDVITRAARFENGGADTLTLGKAASACLDLPFGRWELLQFHGRHAMERQPERAPLQNGIQTVASRRGASSHHHNPFVVLCRPDATEDAGDCCGVMLVYSGSHRTDVELDQNGMTRVVTGIHDEGFSWRLGPGECFQTPEALLCWSESGLGELSRRYHRFLRDNICRGKYQYARRPVLLNNWEATYFDFDDRKLLTIAEQAAALGVEMLVLDDGWFGARCDDNRSLGDWQVNERKLPGGLRPLIEKINKLGMKFGLWIEPEMVSEDSELYRAHPDWAFTLPGRLPAMGRNQLVLDLSRGEVVDYLAETITKLLRENPIDYVKWDMNRSLSDVYSRALPPERQGEAAHRHLLGVYRLLDILTRRFPDVLFEGCAGGGGRFDAGMLCYCPQIWCSDNTDAIERLAIQYGTSFGYPVSAVGAHVSASPNHQTGRHTPLWTRAVVAMSGTFGFELDPGRLSQDEKEQIRAQIAFFRRYDGLIQNGGYYRLTGTDGDFAAWEFVSPDKSEALLNLVVTHPRGNPAPLHLCWKGLDPDARYRVREAHCDGRAAGQFGGEAGRFSGSRLLYAGMTLGQFSGDYPCMQIVLERE